MDKVFWHKCWERNALGFHQQEIHPFLSRYLENLLRDEDGHVFVPLCGKSLDMAWLAERMQVSGAELSEIACRDFFREKGIDYQSRHQGDFQLFSYDNLTLWQGDFFKLSPELPPRVDWIYDRASLVALPEGMQQAYVDKLLTFMTTDTRILLVSVEYPPEEMAGPPFPVFEQDIRRLFAKDKNLKIEKLASLVHEDKRFAQRTFDVSSLAETLYLISR
ncbi:thiopurine S-methyltransferase [Thalassomonas viridans]|uniref:Thiopurine S-methyltransferase n=1 Tax=Thalassomonas viridans TaxID=137584 RepID=A0AAE9YZZ0_9GAMM|nr:thiopurine S-methyltransferase [Thalassomonas viridans]WDE03519.1 thiopurine S-methyltransferase [Thalassomonas viridans]